MTEAEKRARQVFEELHPLAAWEIKQLGEEVARAIQMGQRQMKDEWKGFLAGWQARDSEQSDGWISVEARLPPFDRFVDVVIGGITQICPARLIDNAWQWLDEVDSAPLDIVTHWRERPSPPSAAQGETRK